MDKETQRFVLVPVPAVHVLDVMRWLVYRDTQRTESAEWDETALADMLASLPDSTRTLVDLIARGTVAGREMSVRDLAAEAREDPKDVGTTIQDINRRARERGLPELIDVQRDTVDDEAGVAQPVFRLALRPGLAPLLTATED